MDNSLYGNYRYSLTGDQQSVIQMFLRSLPEKVVREAFGGHDAYSLLHSLTYADSWSKEPKFPLATMDR